MKPRTVFITQVRTGSTRLPGKSMKTIHGKTVLSLFLDRALLIPEIDLWCVATTESPDDDVIVSFVREDYPDVSVVRGSETDVLNRYVKAIRETDADVVVRITSDCPFLDWDLAGRCIEYRHRTHADVVRTRRGDIPLGLDIEVFRAEALIRADSETENVYDREHVGPYVYNNPDKFVVEWFSYLGPKWPRCRLTLDYPEDLELVRSVYEELDFMAPAESIRLFLEAHPEIALMNLMHDHP